MPAPRTAPRSAPGNTDTTRSAHAEIPRRAESREAPSSPDTATDVVRWAAFSCVLVPVVLVWYGTSLAGAAGAALGLAAVTGACRVLLRQSERGAARLLADEPTSHRGRHGRNGSGARRGGRHTGPSAPVD